MVGFAAPREKHVSTTSLFIKPLCYRLCYWIFYPMPAYGMRPSDIGKRRVGLCKIPGLNTSNRSRIGLVVRGGRAALPSSLHQNVLTYPHSLQVALSEDSSRRCSTWMTRELISRFRATLQSPLLESQQKDHNPWLGE